MVELLVKNDEEVNFEVGVGYITLELSPARAMQIWLQLEAILESEGLIWEER